MFYMITIYVDADGCQVKDEIYKVAERYQLRVFVVANQAMRVPLDTRIQLKVVPGDFDAADDWIAQRVSAQDIVVTGDILLAERCLKAKARVLGPKGVEFTEDTIGDAVATRELMQNLRYFDGKSGSPKPMEKKDRSHFLGKLDQIIQALKRQFPSP